MGLYITRLTVEAKVNPMVNQVNLFLFHEFRHAG